MFGKAYGIRRQAIVLTAALAIAMMVMGAGRAAIAFDLSSLANKAKDLVQSKMDSDKAKVAMEKNCKGSFQLNDFTVDPKIANTGVGGAARCSAVLRAAQYTGSYRAGITALYVRYDPPGRVRTDGLYTRYLSFETPPNPKPIGLNPGTYKVPGQFDVTWFGLDLDCPAGSGTLTIKTVGAVGDLVTGEYSIGVKQGAGAKCPAQLAGTFALPRMKG
jgi:hypothetical protein